MTYAPEETSSDATPADGERPARRGLGCAFEIIETLVLTLVIDLLIHNFVAQPFEVQQHSMEPTITPSDYVLIEKVTPRFGDYQRGDVIVFNPPSGYEQNGIPFIKRVIGLPGDTVTLENGAVLITPPGGSTVRIDEPYIARTGDGRPVPTQNHGPNPQTEWVVPAGSYFVMGDNRGASEDSRVFGPIARDSIIGRAWLRYFPLDRIGFIQRPTYPGLSSEPQASPAARVMNASVAPPPRVAGRQAVPRKAVAWTG
jgi:signal peptidase I